MESRPHAGPPRARLHRETIGIDGVAARLEHRLHWTETDHERLQAGCAFAVESGVAAVLCRPEHVSLAAEHVAGSAVDVVTALGFHDPASHLRSPSDLAEEADQLTTQGAAEVALIAARRSSADVGTDLLTEQVNAVMDAVAPHAGRVRVLLNSTGMSPGDVVTCCHALATTGVSLVQGGSFRGDRTGFSQLEVMRAALPRQVLLKWTHPVRSIDTMLVCIALGVDRFNGEPAELLAAAGRHLDIAPLMVPRPGLDF